MKAEKFIMGLLLACGVAGLMIMGVAWWRSQPIDSNHSNSATNLEIIPATRDDDPAIGAVNAPVTIIAFEDFQCPYCAEAYPIIQQLLQKYPNQLVFVYRDFPLTTLHPQALEAGLAANCANEQGKFWQYHHALFDQQDRFTQTGFYQSLAQQLQLNTSQFDSCLSTKKYASEIQADFDAGVLAGVTRTPTWFVNGVKLEGVYSLAEWEQMIQAYLSQ